MENSSAKTIENEPKKLPFNNLFLNAGLVDGLNKPWMYVVGVLITILAYLFGGSILTLPLIQKAMAAGVSIKEISENNYIIFDSERIQVNKNLILALQFGFFVCTLLGLYAAIKFIHKKTFLSVVTAFEKFRFKYFMFAFGLWAFILITAMVITYLANPEGLILQFDFSKFIVLFLLCLVFMPIQTLVEEVFFRGYLLQGLSQVFKNGIVPLIITSVLFAFAHLSNPEIGAYGKGLMLGYYIMFALFMGAITLLSEGLELAYGIHLANNLVSALLLTSKHSVLKTDAIFFADTEDARAELVLAFCAIIAVFIIFWLKYRWKNFSLLIK